MPRSYDQGFWSRNGPLDQSWSRSLISEIVLVRFLFVWYNIKGDLTKWLAYFKLGINSLIYEGHIGYENVNLLHNQNIEYFVYT